MAADVVLAAVLGGAATYLLRYLPMRLRRLPAEASAGRDVLGAIGPTAILAMLVISLLGLAGPAADGWGARTGVVVGLVAVAVAHRLTRNIALATVLGALVFGLVRALLG